MDQTHIQQPAGLTWDEFLALPYETRNASLIDGEVVEIWCVDPVRRTVLVCRRPEPGLTYKDFELNDNSNLTSPLLESFEVPVRDLFARRRRP